jgi:hypothetical protein
VGEQTSPFAGVPVAVAVGVSIGVLVAVAVGVSIGVLVAVAVGVSIGVLVAAAVGVSIGVLVAVAVGISVGVLVGMLVGVFDGVLVLVGVGVGLRHTPLTQSTPARQQVFPQTVVPATQAQRRRPVESFGKHEFAQQFPALRQIVPPGRHTAAASPVVERSTFAAGTPMPSASAAPPSARRRS